MPLWLIILIPVLIAVSVLGVVTTLMFPAIRGLIATPWIWAKSGFTVVKKPFAWTYAKTGEGIRWAYKDYNQLGMVTFWVMITYGILHFFFRYGSVQKPWTDLFSDLGLASGFVVAMTVLALFSVMAIRSGIVVKDTWFHKYAWRISISMAILVITIPLIWLWTVDRLEERDVPSILPPVVQQTQVAATATSIPAPTVAPKATVSTGMPDSTKIVPSEVTTVSGNKHVRINGRNPYGTEVLTIRPGERVRITHTEGAVSTWQHSTKEYRTYPLWGNSAGYVPLAKVRGLDAWNWSDNYRYDNLAFEGVMPQEILVIVGNVGSGNERVVPFPNGVRTVEVENTSGTSKPLVIYYHGMDYYYLGNSGSCLDEKVPYSYPTMSAASCSSVAVQYIDGWGDQGLDGSVARFVVEMLD